MLILGTALSNTLKSKATEACWLLDLYYNDDDVATNVIHLSDKDRTVGGVDYIGIVRSWGSLHQAADLIAFSSSISTVAIILDNAENTIANGRFTDLFSSKNFVNRKWNLYLSDGVNKSTDSIGLGIISADIKVDDRNVEIYLFDYESIYFDELPTTIITKASYPQTPDTNLNKPIPMTFGDFDRVVSTTGANLDRCIVKSYLPAIITDFDDIDAIMDTKTQKMIRKRNLYMQLGKEYAACAPANVSAPAADGTGTLFTFGGNSYFIYIPILSGDQTELFDLDTSVTYTFSSANEGDMITKEFYLKSMESEVGTVVSINVNFDWVSESGPVLSMVKAYYQPNSTDGYGNAAEITLNDIGDADFTLNPAGSKLPTQGAKLKITFVSGDPADPATLEIGEITVEIQVRPKETFVQRIKTVYKITYRRIEARSYKMGIQSDWTSGGLIPKLTARAANIYAPADIEYIYFAGQGRLFGAWIDADSRNQGYNENDLIYNPVYIVESILRDDLGLTSAKIDYAGFDIAGNTTDGLIADVFADAIADIKFAFSQYQFINGKSFIEKIGHQCGTLFFLSGSNKIKAKVRRRPTDYSAGDEDMKIDYNDIRNISYKQTFINNVRNDIIVHYNFDYIREETKEIQTATDATSKGNTSSGYNQTLELEEVMDCVLDDTTANKYADALLAWHKDRHLIIKLETVLPRYQTLEIGDVITFLNWSSDFKVYGTVPTTTDLFMIQDITKSGSDKTMIEVMEVSA